MDFISELRWRPTIADPTLLGWFTVAAYASGAVLAVMAALGGTESDTELKKRNRTLWLAIAVLLAGLGVNRQLYLQSLVTEIGRLLAQHQSWYGHRQGFQESAVVAVLMGAGAFAGWLIWRFNAFCVNHRLLMAGLLLLLTLLVVRTISFHPVDVVLRATILGLRLNRALELTGILLVSLAAINERRASNTRN